MSLLTPEVEAMIGVESDLEIACEPVERGAVRRFAQASLDDDPVYHDTEAAARYGGPIAPPLFPMTMFRRDFRTPDPLVERAEDPDFDGIVGSTAQGLPPLPLPSLSLLNAGTEVELVRYARHGETVRSLSRYERVYEKSGKSGSMLFVVIATDYVAGDGDLLMRVRKTQIRRPA
jgi:hypothetical protein